MTKLNTGSFNADDLIRLQAPPNLRSVMVGNKVMLRSGGPTMIVSEVIDADNAMCQWMDDGVLQKHAFHLACLTCAL